MKILALLMCFTFPLVANSLDDLKATLGRLRGQSPVRGSYEVQTWIKAGMGKDNDEVNGAATAWVEENETGVHLTWDRQLLSRAEAEEEKSGEAGKPKNSISAALSSATALEVARALNGAARLARLLEKGQLLQQRADVFHGKPAQLLEVNIEPAMTPEERKKIKEISRTAKIWLGADGIPLGASLTLATKARMMLISLQQNKQDDFEFTTVKDRLVIVRREERENTKTLGIESQRRTISVFTPK